MSVIRLSMRIGVVKPKKMVVVNEKNFGKNLVNEKERFSVNMSDGWNEKTMNVAIGRKWRKESASIKRC